MKVATVVVMVYVSPAVSMHIPAVEGVFMRPASRPPRQHTTCSSFSWAHLRSYYTCSVVTHSTTTLAISFSFDRCDGFLAN